MKNKRVLLKISGEALKNKSNTIIDFEYLEYICEKIKKLYELGYQFGIVIGGGNIWRGRNNCYIDNNSSDMIGLLGTTINALSLNSMFESLNIPTVFINAFEIENIIKKTEDINLQEEIENKIIVFGGGTGNGGCSTDTAAALRAIDINADLIVKLTNVDGVYDKDPNKYNNAKKYDKLKFDETIEKQLNVMDMDSILLCKENHIPIVVMNIDKLDKLNLLLEGKTMGTIIE